MFEALFIVGVFVVGFIVGAVSIALHAIAQYNK